MVQKGGKKNIDYGKKCEIPGYQTVYYIWKCLRCINKLKKKTDSDFFFFYFNVNISVLTYTLM